MIDHVITYVLIGYILCEMMQLAIKHKRVDFNIEGGFSAIHMIMMIVGWPILSLKFVVKTIRDFPTKPFQAVFSLWLQFGTLSALWWGLHLGIVFIRASI